MRAPDFWFRSDAAAGLAAAALAPLGWLYGGAVGWKRRHAKPWRAGVPVVCIGNISAGGTGKTPVAIAVAKTLIARGRKPFFLSRGYGGRLKGPVLVGENHTAAEVGDEPLLLAGTAPTVVARHRPDGALLAAAHGADVIVMDDGHQNFTLAKDLSLVVVDGDIGFGNGRVLPAGPLREPAAAGLARADAVIVNGDGDPLLPGFTGAVLRAKVAPVDDGRWQGRRVVAFAGIGRPEKLFRSLAALGAEVVEAIAFADHHPYTAAELAALKAKGLAPVTTEKDFVRIAPADRDGIAFLPVTATVMPPDGLDRLLDRLPAPR